MGKRSAVLWARIDDVADDESAGAELLSGKLPPSIWPVNPFRLNERLTIQQGLFLAPGDATRGFLGNIGRLPPDGLGSALSCYIIPRAQSGVVQRSLYEMNITETTLFPGLDGFAQSLWSLPDIEEGLKRREVIGHDRRRLRAQEQTGCDRMTVSGNTEACDGPTP